MHSEMYRAIPPRYGVGRACVLSGVVGESIILRLFASLIMSGVVNSAIHNVTINGTKKFII